MCTPAGGRAAAQEVVDEGNVVGAIGTSCSGAGAAPFVFEELELRTVGTVDIEDIFFPLYPLAPPFIEQFPEALSALPLVSADALLTSEFLGEDASEGLYIAGPITTFGNVNSLTGKSEARSRR